MIIQDLMFFFSIELFFFRVHLVMHPHGIAPTILELDLWSPGAGLFLLYIIICKKKKLSFKHSKRIDTFLKRWMQFRVVTIPRLPLHSIY